MAVKNINLFIKNNTLLFVFLCITQIISVTIILFAYGVYLNNQYTLNTDLSRQSSFNVKFPEEQYMEKECGQKVKDAFPELLMNYEAILDSCWIESNLIVDTEQVVFNSVFGISEGKFTYYDGYENLLSAIEGRWFSDEELNSGENVCIVSRELWETYGDTIVINDLEYSVVSMGRKDEEIHTSYGSMAALSGLINCMPAESIPDDGVVVSIDINFTRPITRSEYENLTEIFQQTFGYGVLKFSDFYVVSADENATAKTMMTISIFLSILSSYCICMIYKFVLDKRLKMTAIYQICGSTPWKAAKIYLKELFLIQICCVVLGLVSFWYILKPKVSQQYIWFEIIYGDWKCFLFLGIYIVLVWFSSIMMIKNEIRKTPIVMLKR